MCENYLLTHHKSELCAILENQNANHHFSINICFIELFDDDPNFGNEILNDFEAAVEELESDVQACQRFLIDELNQKDRYASIKPNVHCRFYGLPTWAELHRNTFPKSEDAGNFIQISGTVVRISLAKVLEFKREYICRKCKYKIICEAEYERKNIISPPMKCKNPDGNCNSTNFASDATLQSKFCKDYQEIKIQENVDRLGFGSVPSSLCVTLDNNLVDSCQPGDNVTISGIVKRRWSPYIVGNKIDIELVMKANHVSVNNMCSLQNFLTEDMRETFSRFWETYKDVPVVGRDVIVKSFCPQVFGLYWVKLAIAVVLAGGSQQNQVFSSGKIRSEPHLLLVGDPGTGKSKLLRFASQVLPRSVLTTGIGSTAAGLTVAAVMEDGEWHLEGGALVLANGGICCIDEFNSMKEHDRTSIHEAMEQQTISVAKASIVSKLSTKCSILAATNPKGNIDPTQPLSMNLALASPLLSRFDLILLIRDTVEQDWDNLVADYILNEYGTKKSEFIKDNCWSLEMLQAYFNIIKKIHAPLTAEAHRILDKYYQFKRVQNFRNKSRTTARLLDSLVRLSQGHAKLLYHDTVQTVDAIMAIVLIEMGMGYQEESLLNFNFNVHSSISENPLDDYVEIIECILKKLDLQDILDQEMSFLENSRKLVGTKAVRFESRHFHKGDISKNCDRITEESPERDNNLGSNNSEEERSGVLDTESTENTREFISSQNIFEDEDQVLDDLNLDSENCDIGTKPNSVNSRKEEGNEHSSQRTNSHNQLSQCFTQLERNIFQSDNLIDDLDLEL